jgi:hypothetical protein
MAGVVVELTGDEAKLLASMQKIIAQNARSKDSFKNTGREAKSSIDEINKALTKKLESLASVSVAYKAVEVGVAAVSKAQQIMLEKQAKALQLAKELAAAQQEAAKNLAGQSSANISKSLLETVPSIAVKTGFSDLPKLTTALGSSASIIGEELAPSAVEVAAQLTRFTKEDLQSTATSTADVMKAAQLKSGEEAMALLLTSGAVARPEELTKLAGGASKAIYAGVNASPGQLPAEAAKDAASLFAVLSKVDKQGESAATAAIQFIDLLRTTFNPSIDERAKRDERIKELLGEQAVTAEEQVAIDRALLSVRQKEALTKNLSPSDKSLRAEDLRIDLAEAKASVVRATKAAGLTDKESVELSRLQDQQRLSTNDPGTLVGRLQAIQQSPELLRTAEANLKGEAAFKAIAQGFFDPNSVHMQGLTESLGSITTEATKFKDALATMAITPQQKLAGSIEQSDVANNVARFLDTDAQVFGAVDRIVKESFAQNTVGGLKGLLQNASTGVFSSLGFDVASVSSFSSTPDAAVKNAILTLESQKVDVGDDKIKVESIQRSIEALKQIGVDNAQRTADARKLQESIDQQNKTLERIANATEGNMNGSNANAIRQQSQQPRAE